MKYLLAIFALALVMSAGAAWASTGLPDGLINGKTGGTGYFPVPSHLPNGVCNNFVETTVAWDLNGGNVVIFDYDDNTWVNCGQNFVAEQNPLKVVCDIEMYAREHLDATDIYFHIGDGENVTLMQATVHGWFKSNNGQFIGITKDNVWTQNDGPKYVNPAYNNKAAELKFKTDGLGRTTVTPNNNNDPIPLKIYFRDVSMVWRLVSGAPGSNDVWDAGTGGNWGYYWLVDEGRPSFQQYDFLFEISPKYHQGDGRYELDPVVTLAPAL
jgi:hypothetical protein